MECNIESVTFSDGLFSAMEGVEQYIVFAIGYEDRSIHIPLRVLSQILDGSIRPKVFLFRDYIPCGGQAELLKQLSIAGVEPIVVSYEEHGMVIDIVRDLLKSIGSDKKVTLHIDYSSMPRSWYCRFPSVVANLIESIHKTFFWYSIGNYEPAKEGFPSTGVRDIRVFSGRATLRAENKRSHIFGLGFDHIRMQGILSVLDPSYYCVCYAYPSWRREILDKVKDENGELINSAALAFELQLQDFKFMISKLSDIANMLVGKGDVIFVPDGPKPLTLACSMVPSLLEKMGIICLHVKRHETFFEPLNVIPSGEIVGFCFGGDAANES